MIWILYVAIVVATFIVYTYWAFDRGFGIGIQRGIQEGLHIAETIRYNAAETAAKYLKENPPEEEPLPAGGPYVPKHMYDNACKQRDEAFERARAAEEGRETKVEEVSSCTKCRDGILPRFNANNEPCDMVDGPCCCGAWHNPEEMRQFICYCDQGYALFEKHIRVCSGCGFGFLKYDGNGALCRVCVEDREAASDV